MDVIGHWICEACGRSGADPLKLTHPKLGNEGQRCHGPVVRVEYVPRSDLRGAVEAGNALFAVLDGVWSGKDGGYSQAEVEAVMEQWLNATLGGQYKDPPTTPPGG